MDKAIKRGFEKVKAQATKEEKKLVNEDKKLDKQCKARRKKDR